MTSPQQFTSTEPIHPGAPSLDHSLFNLGRAVTSGAEPSVGPVAAPCPHLTAEQLRGFHLLGRNVEDAVLQQFRQLRGRLIRRASQLGSSAGPRSVLVTSAEPDAGKSFVAANLALMLGVAPETRVLLTEANHARPALSQRFLLPDQAALHAAIGGADWRTLAFQVPHMEVFVTPGGLPGSAIPPLETSLLSRWFRRLEGHLDWLLLDGPSLKESPDAEMLAHVCDLVVIVVRPGSISCRELAATLGRLDRARLAGFVFNGHA